MQKLARHRNVEFRPLKQAGDLFRQQQSHLLSLSLVLYFLAPIRVGPSLWVDYTISQVGLDHTPFDSSSLTEIRKISSPSLATVPIAHSTAYLLSSDKSLRTT
jgi:hypothetical protein